MGDTDACLPKGKTPVISDPSVIARRKRMEIRRFKKLASSTQLLLDDPLFLENNIFGLKRPRIGQASMECANSSDDKQTNITLSPVLHTEEPSFIPPPTGQEVIKLEGTSPSASLQVDDIGFRRYKSLPPMEARCSEPDADVDEGRVVEREGHSVCLSLRTFEAQVAGSSASEAVRSLSLPSASLSMVDISTDIEKEGLKAEPVSPFLAAEHGLLPCRVLSENVSASSGAVVGTSDAVMIDLAKESSTIPTDEGVGLTTSQSVDLLRQVPSDCNFPPSGKLLVCGRRREMEDTATIVPSFTQLRCYTPGNCLCDTKAKDRPLCDLHFFAVYDGHGGSQASNFCMENLHHALAEEISSMQEGKGEPSEGSCSSSVWERAMFSCFSRMDREVGGVCPNGLCDDVDSSAICCSGSIAPENVGTTAVVAVVSSCRIVVANCGDSRAVLSRGGTAIPLSRDHKPDRDDEYSRIEAAGGRVIYWDGHRVGGLLALSRAIGDRYLKRYVICKPEVTCLERTEEDECLILASDGVWDVISNDTACEIARKCLNLSRRKRALGTFALGEDPACAAVAALLVKLAYGRGSKDNISVVVIDLKA